jgi:hypothetical protein
MKSWQVVEKESNGVDWAQVRYNAYALGPFDTPEEAKIAAKKYLTDLNCENALAAAEKQASAEAYMDTEDGIFLGVLNGKDWYMTYPKEVRGKDPDGKVKILHQKGETVKDRSYYEIEGKTEVSVRKLPGT